MSPGTVAFVLTAHMPYLRAPGRSPLGEDALHHLIATALIPTLTTLCDLRDQGVQARVGLAWSPLLLEQLADPVVQKHFGFWMDDQFARLAATAIAYTATNRSERVYLAQFYHEWATGIRHAFDERFGRNLVGTLRQLCEAGLVEPLASMATQPPAALLARPALCRAQCDLGMLAVARRLGRPQGFWLGGHVRAATIDAVVATGAAYALIDPARLPLGATHLRPYVLPTQRLGLLAHDPAVVPYLRPPQLAYRGDPLYRAATRDVDGFAWQRNGLGTGVEAYDPYDAYRRAQEHALHFAAVLAAELAQAEAPACAVVALDADLLGGRWFEGAAWFAALLAALAARDDLALATPAACLHGQRPRRPIALVAEPPRLPRPHDAGRFARAAALRIVETRLLAVIAAMPDASGDHERVLQQAVRELLLAQTGDAPDAPPAAERPTRTRRHLARCVQLCGLAELPSLTDATLTLLETLEEQDNPFPYLNYRMLAPGDVP